MGDSIVAAGVTIRLNRRPANIAMPVARSQAGRQEGERHSNHPQISTLHLKAMLLRGFK